MMSFQNGLSRSSLKATLFAPLFLSALMLSTATLWGQDPNFHIYLSFGQSNMAGAGDIEKQDKVVDDRFRVFQSLDCPNLGRSKERWYSAEPPLCGCHSGLSPTDYFGRTMVENLPDSIRVGVINVSVPAAKIELYDLELYQEYLATVPSSWGWFKDILSWYDYNPYRYLIDLALKAQKDGVIKGILLHQGESNTGDPYWSAMVKKIYGDMLRDLSLKAQDVPLLAGEVLSAPGNCCSLMNSFINRLPNAVPTAYVISSEGCTAKDDAHFDSEGNREMGRRYAQKMLMLLKK